MLFDDLNNISDDKENEITHLRQLLQAIEHQVYYVNIYNYKYHSSSIAENSNKTCFQHVYGFEKPCTHYNLQCPIDYIKTNKKSVTLEHKVVSKDNTNYYKIKASPVFDQQNNLIGIVEQKIDITEEKLNEQLLKDSEAKYKAVLQQSADNIYLLDIDNYKILEANQALQLLLGYNSDEMKKLTLFDFINHPKEDIMQKIDRMKKIDRIFLSHRQYKTKDDKIIDVEVSSTIIKFKGKQTICVVSRDITNRIKTEKELQKAKKEAEEANKLKSVIISNVSHELRTPLNGIIGFTQILMEECNDPEHLEMLQALEKSGKRLHKTINSLLALSELESENFKINFEVHNFSEIVKSAVIIFEEFTRNKNILLIDSILDKKICAKVDEYLINQILYNLIQNSVKYTNRGYIKIEADSETRDGLIFAVIRVKDSGSGISDDQLNHVFDAFRQGSEGIERDNEGVGIGLTISKKMVEMMGGTIEVTSQLAVGSTFSLYFPAY